MKTRNYSHRLALLLAFVIVHASPAAPPINDDFTNRTVLTGTDISFSGTLAEATRESTNELTPPLGYGADPATQSVWWTWTPTANTTAIIQILNPSKETHGDDGLAVYTADNATNGQLVAGIALDSVWPVMFLTFQAEADASYQIQLTGSDSAGFSFRLVATNLPFILQQPQSQTVTVNDSVMFGVVAAGYKSEYSSHFTYQWQFNGTNLIGETGAVLGLNSLTTNQAGAYRVVVSNDVGTTTSDVAQLFIRPGDAAATLAVPQPQGASEFSFSLLGEIGRRYRIESSTNLTDWLPEASFPSIFYYYNGDLKSVVMNSTGSNSFVVKMTTPQRFFCASPFHATNEVCNNNLKILYFAFLLDAYDQEYQPNWSSSDPASYLKNREWLACPDFDGLYTFPFPFTGENPSCSIHSFEEKY